MRHVTISTTGIFNAIRPSLFPPIEGKETTTFFAWLGFSYLFSLSKTNGATLKANMVTSGTYQLP